MMKAWLQCGAVLGLVTAPLLGAAIPEPATVFYGRVVNRSSGPEFLVTEGQLEWVVESGVGGAGSRRFTTRLQPLGDGTFSYRLKIPQVLAETLDGAEVHAIPVGPQVVRYRHVRVTIDGQPARWLAESPGFDASSSERAIAHRVDLELTTPLPDTDGDGLPDWWEDRYGSDRRQPDAGVRLAGGLTYAESFRWQLDPREDHRLPRLLTETVVVYPGGTSSVLLQTIDADTPPERLRYTVVGLPVGGTLMRHPETGEPVPLATGEGFTQAEVDAGRIRFTQAGAEPANGRFEFSVRDDDPAHPAASAVIQVESFDLAQRTGLQPEAWYDAAGLKDVDARGGHWPDRSGHRRDASRRDGSSLRQMAGPGSSGAVVGLEGRPMVVGTGTDSGITGMGDWTILAVVRADAGGPQQLFSTPTFEIGIGQGAAAEGGGRVRFGSDVETTYSETALVGGWRLLEASRVLGRPSLSIDGLSTPLEPRTEASLVPGTHTTLGGKTTGRFDAASQTWEMTANEGWVGALAELVALPGGLTTEAELSLEAYLQSKWFGAVVCDGTRRRTPLRLLVNPPGRRPAVSSAEPRHYLLGGAGDDVLAGGGADDVVVGGSGNDRLTGGAGADRFVFLTSVGETDTITDFTPSEGDRLDLSRVMKGSSEVLSDYVRVVYLGTRSVLEVDAHGNGRDYNDLRIELENFSLPPTDLESLWRSGRLVVAPWIQEATTEQGPSRVTVVASVPAIREEAGMSGEFVLRRSGSRTESLTVEVRLGGTAQNGVDYAFLPSRVTFPRGESTVRLVVEPFPDAAMEPTEIVELSIVTGTGYGAGNPGSARMSITDPPEQFSLEILEPVASRLDEAAAAVRIRRTGAVDRTTVVVMSLSGTAINGIDYLRVPATVTFAPGQLTAVVNIQPKPGRPPLVDTKTVEVGLVPDSGNSYVLGTSAAVRIHLVEESMSFDRWRAEQLPNVNGSTALVATMDSDGDQLSNLVEYAFGLDPNRRDDMETTRALPRAVLRHGHLNIEFRQPPSRRDVLYLVETSDDLSQWTPASERFEAITLDAPASAAGWRCLRDRNPSQVQSQQFVRVRVKLP